MYSETIHRFRRATGSLLAALPKCDQCDQPAGNLSTGDRPDEERWCLAHIPEGLYVGDYPVAAALAEAHELLRDTEPPAPNAADPGEHERARNAAQARWTLRAVDHAVQTWECLGSPKRTAAARGNFTRAVKLLDVLLGEHPDAEARLIGVVVLDRGAVETHLRRVVDVIMAANISRSFVSGSKTTQCELLACALANYVVQYALLALQELEPPRKA